ncbi:hypothetical protein [Bacteroides intestinalis]|uniref:hypothetical protein n=1 Tax=Bacteroides intestinalis TaxID=329854 RepID=UPI00189D6310|nr:hypothetical protein [Bacteroides intestinalis]
MGQFVKLIGIRTEHGYYKNVTGKFRIVPTAKTEKLMRSRGILFRPTDDGCQWLIADDCSGFMPGDRLECVLQVRDADFMHVTQLGDYQPQSFYRLNLSDENPVKDVVSSLVPADAPSMSGGPCFCSLSIGLTDDMPEEGKKGNPLEYRLGFREAAYRWEYLFVRRNEDANVSKVLLLEDTRGRILFPLPKKLTDTPYGETAWQMVSSSPVVCRQHPDCNLLLTEVPTEELVGKLAGKLESQGRLTPELEKDIRSGEFSRLPAEAVLEVVSDKSLKRKTVSRFVPCPQPGRYKPGEQDCIRQVCYI